MKEAKEAVIEGVTYKVMPLLTSEGLIILTRLTKLMAPAAAAGLGGETDAEGVDEELNIGRAVAALAASLEEAQTLDTIKRLVSEQRVQHTNPEGNMVPLRFDHHFSGDYKALFQVVKLSLEVNFGDFFGVVGGLFKEALATELVKKAAKSPKK